MKALHTLLKIAKREMDVLQRSLAAQNQRLQTIEDRLLGHAQTIRDEQQAAQRDYESSRAYGGFAALAMQQRRALESEKVLVEAEIARVRTLITDAHVEVKKFTRLLELEQARAKLATDKREAAELDDFATMHSGRRTPGA